MLDSSYLSLIQDTYTSVFTGTLNNSNFSHLSDLSSLLVASKTKNSSTDYAEKIVEVASSDAQNDVKNGNSESWQNSSSYLKLKDEYVESGISKSSKFTPYTEDPAYNNALSQYLYTAFKSLSDPYSSKTSKTETPLSQMNKMFAKAMNDQVTRSVRETEFDLNYNYAYNAYKTQYAEMQSELDVSV